MNRGESGDPTYRGQVDPVTADKRERVIPRSGLRRFQVKLDNALVEQEFTVRGDFLYADSDSTGKITVKLNNTSEDPMPFTAQARVRNYPLEKIYVSCAAQPGLVVNLWYGYAALIDPPQQIVSITGSVVLAQTAAGAPAGDDLIASNGNAFVMGFGINGAAGQFSMLQIFNPVASGKRIYLDKIDVLNLGPPGAGTFPTLWKMVAALAGGTLFATNQTNRKLGAAAPSAETRTLSSAATQGTVIDVQLDVGAVIGYAIAPARGPFILDPGNGLHVMSAGVAQLIEVRYEWREY